LVKKYSMFKLSIQWRFDRVNEDKNWRSIWNSKTGKSRNIFFKNLTSDTVPLKNTYSSFIIFLLMRFCWGITSNHNMRRRGEGGCGGGGGGPENIEWDGVFFPSFPLDFPWWLCCVHFLNSGVGFKLYFRQIFSSLYAEKLYQQSTSQTIVSGIKSHTNWLKSSNKKRT
jgi:hypothetical protein